MSVRGRTVHKVEFQRPLSERESVTQSEITDIAAVGILEGGWPNITRQETSVVSVPEQIVGIHILVFRRMEWALRHLKRESVRGCDAETSGNSGTGSRARCSENTEQE